MAERLSIADQVAMSAQEAAPDFDPLALALTLSLYRTMSAFDRMHAEELGPAGLSVTQFNVLSVLLRVQKPLTMGELAQAISVRSANLTAVADSLAARGLVDRALNPDDRRSFLVSITPEGHKFMAEFLPAHWRVLQDLMSGLSRPERTKLLKLLEKLFVSLQESEHALQVARINGRRRNGGAAGRRLNPAGGTGPSERRPHRPCTPTACSGSCRPSDGVTAELGPAGVEIGTNVDGAPLESSILEIF